MRITRFRIQGFKNIADITVEGLSDINVFFGLNDVGKSNVFEALTLWRQLVVTYPQPRSMKTEVTLHEFERSFGRGLFSFNGTNAFGIEAEVITEKQELLRKQVFSGIELRREP